MDTLRLKPVSATRSGLELTVTLEFEARSNKTYTVSFSPTGAEASWTKLVNVSAVPTNRLCSVFDVWPVTVGQRFYRLATPKLP
jgi:hypothetical protein